MVQVAPPPPPPKIVEPPVVVEEEIPAPPVVVIEPEVAPAPPVAVAVAVHDQLNNNAETVTETVIAEVPPVAVPAPETEKPVAPADSNNNAPPPPSAALTFYAAGQWSPVNPAGRRYYTREQLLQLKELPAAVARPAIPDAVKSLLTKNHENLLAVLKNTQIQANSRSQMGQTRAPSVPAADMMPKFAQPAGRQFTKRSLTGGGAGAGGSQRGSQTGGGAAPSGGPFIKMSLSLKEDVKLNEAAHAWRPKHLSSDVTDSSDDKGTFELYKKFRR